MSSYVLPFSGFKYSKRVYRFQGVEDYKRVRAFRADTPIAVPL